jgi:methionyl-tRNA formyltransferase
MSTAYVVCGNKSWNKQVFDETLSRLPGNWRYMGSKKELTVETLQEILPRYVFFLHWSWIVPDNIVNAFECVNFHMTDLPYGRGGSPLQNLILRGHTETKLTAHRMVEQLDAGPVYLKEPLSLDGTAEDILKRSSLLAASMIERIIREEPMPKTQTGEPVLFSRRTPEQSEIPKNLAPRQLFDFIRMLDAEGYPRAFLRYNDFRYELRNARLEDGTVRADVSIIPDSPRS